MNPVLTAREMSLADRAAIEELRTGETRLMELAGRETVRMIAERFESGRSLDGFRRSSSAARATTAATASSWRATS